MPVEWYIACPYCHHVDIEVSREDLPSHCSNCGSLDSRWRRAYIRPRGFVTSYTDRNGKDPGTHRRRQRRADEARLITIPRDDQFADTDHRDVQSVVLRAYPLEEDERPGQMFIVNRGPYGFGYHVCDLCNHAEPAQQRGQKHIKHSEPLTGRECRNNNLLYPRDLAHEFDTDVLLIRISRSLPEPPMTHANPRQFIESFARTLAEAMRFAAAEILAIQATELRASFRLRVPQLEVVLYDAVAGGAGYCVRLQQEFSMNALLSHATKRLDCSRQCATACSNCLCDYSNQQSWDQFDRRPVLEWLQQLTNEVETDPFINHGAVRWKRPSLQGFTEQIAGMQELHIVGLDLEVSEGEDEDIRRWLLKILNNGKRVSIHLLRDIPAVPAQLTARWRQTLLYLYPYIKEGQLVVGQVTGIQEKQLASKPRIFCNTELGSSVWYSAYPLPAILDKLLPEPVYKHSVDRELAEELKVIITNTTPYPVSRFQFSAPIERWELEANQARDLNKYFQVLIGAHLEKIIIRDPYCGAAEKQSKALLQFLRYVATQAKTIEKLEIHCREQSQRDTRYRPAYQVKKQLEELLKDIHSKPQVIVHPFQTSRGFHDRTLDFSVVDSAGCSMLHRYDLTGGIDFLMDEHCNTKIYHYKVEK